MRSFIILLLGMTISFFSFGKTNSLQLQNLVADFQIQEYIQKTPSPLEKILLLDGNYKECVQQCREDYGDPDKSHREQKCMDFVCRKVGSYGCDDSDEIRKVAKMCAGVKGNACLELSCSKLGSYGCDDLSELESVASSCRAVRGSKCINYICSKLGSYGCDDLDEITQVTKMCRNNDDQTCIKFSCDKLGYYGCDDLDEIKAVADSCAGRD